MQHAGVDQADLSLVSDEMAELGLARPEALAMQEAQGAERFGEQGLLGIGQRGWLATAVQAVSRLCTSPAIS